ncbi:unnamed protein product, partial [marine sediment metagenome]
INKGKFGIVHLGYMEISKLCEQIGDEQNAALYKESAEKFKLKAVEQKRNTEDLRQAINKAINAAKIAYKNKDFGKISDLYFSVATMLHELGEEDSALKFSNSAKKFRERIAIEQKAKDTVKQLPQEVQKSATQAPISDFRLDNDKKITFFPPQKPFHTVTTGDKIPKPQVKIAREIQPSAIGSMNVNIQKLEALMKGLGLICPGCQLEIKDSSTKKCPKCGSNLR